MHKCPSCLSEYTGETISIREMLLGTRDEFSYNVCQVCESISLADNIDDFSKYYPQDYHCFQSYSMMPSWKKLFLLALIRYNFYKRGLLGMLIAKVFYFKNGYIPEPNIGWVGNAYRMLQNPSKNVSIIDIGCGGGKLLEQLKMLGFTQLSGVEPYGEVNIPGITFTQSGIHEFIQSGTDKKYDIIVLSHVFEHLFHQEDILNGVKRMLSDKGVIVLSMPVLGKLYEQIGTSWLSLDAPRHVSLFTKIGFSSMLERVGLIANSIVYEQSAWDIFASEMYAQDIAFQEIFDRKVAPKNMGAYRKMAELFDKNQEGGGSVTYFLTK